LFPATTVGNAAQATEPRVRYEDKRQLKLFIELAPDLEKDILLHFCFLPGQDDLDDVQDGVGTDKLRSIL